MINIIPSIDLINGAAIRLSEGDFSTSKMYFRDPLDAARMLEHSGVTNLHVIDLDNAKAGKLLSLKALERIIGGTDLFVDYGGGIKSRQDIRDALNAGAVQVNCGSVASKKPEEFSEWLSEMPEEIILSADARDGVVMVDGWMESSGIDLKKFISRFVDSGLKYLTSTDIAKDGRLGGPSFPMYQELRDTFPKLVLCASGGVSSIDEVKELEVMGIERVIIGKAIYEGTITPGNIREFIDNA